MYHIPERIKTIGIVTNSNNNTNINNLFNCTYSVVPVK